MTSNEQSGATVFEFDLTVYRLSAIKKAAYRFVGQFDVQIEPVSDSRVRVSLFERQEKSVRSCDPNSLPSEVLDQELRELVAEETKSIRDLLLAQAFSGLALVDPVGESADYREDPLSIAGASAGDGSIR